MSADSSGAGRVQGEGVRASISVITATFNSAAQLPGLIQSLRGQTDQRFEWVVADGASSDSTLDILRGVEDISLVISSVPDFGIYDALNRAISVASGSHYIVAGADDVFDHHAVANFRGAIDRHGADIVVASVTRGRRRLRIRRGPAWLHGAHAFIAHHSLSCAIRRQLHERFGRYSSSLPIGADALFILTACKAGVVRHEADFYAGSVGGGGVSAVDWAGSATEFFRVQLLTGCWFPAQLFLLALRLIRGAIWGARYTSRRGR